MRLVFVVASGLLLVACADGETPESTANGGGTAPAVTPTTVPCDERADPDLDVATEPDWRRYAAYRDWTRDGCIVRIDVLADRPGPDHCGWEATRVIITGLTLGERFTSASDDVEYVRDPGNVLGLPVAFRTDVLLPTSAIDSGYRSGDAELWTDPTDADGIYVIERGTVEWWPRAEAPLCD